MKFPYLFSIMLLVTFFSCNTDDPSSEDFDEATQINYPLTANSSWTYNNLNEQVGPSRDSLYVAGTEMNNGNLYTNLDAQLPANAFMSQFLSDNLIRTTNTQLIIDGSLGSPIEGLPDVTLPISDLRLYDTAVDVTIDPELGFSTGSIIQDIMDVPVEINYGITSTMLAIPDTSTEDTPQVASQLIVNMEIIAMIPVGPITVPFTIMQPQDVLIATNTYTSEIGLTNSTVLIEFTLEDLSGLGFELPFPESSSNTSTQTIDTFVIGE